MKRLLLTLALAAALCPSARAGDIHHPAPCPPGAVCVSSEPEPEPEPAAEVSLLNLLAELHAAIVGLLG